MPSHALSTKTLFSNAYAAPRRAPPIVVPEGALALVRLFGTGLVGAVMFLLASAVPPPASAEPAPPRETHGCAPPPYEAATPRAAG